jgi:hypothetical protein
MRAIFVGIEYAGKSTLINILEQYYRSRKLGTHADDHFTIPDTSLSPESRKILTGLPDDMKERSQRMQIDYHVHILFYEPFTFLGGWHIEEEIYQTFYGNDPDGYYYNLSHMNNRSLEVEVLKLDLPDLVMVHLTADDDVIRRRMTETPHEYNVIKEKDIPELKRLFAQHVEDSTFTQRGLTVTLDTSNKTPAESLDELLLKTEPMVTTGELAVRAMEIPDGDYEVQYVNGVRKMVPTGN